MSELLSQAPETMLLTDTLTDNAYPSRWQVLTQISGFRLLSREIQVEFWTPGSVGI